MTAVADPTKICSGPKAPWRQINIRAADVLTDETATAIEANNAAREAIGCPYVRPRSKPKPADSVS